MTTNSKTFDNAGRLIEQGRGFLDSGMVHESLELLQQAYKLDANNATCVRLLLEALILVGQDDEAQDIFSNAHHTVSGDTKLITLNSELALRRGEFSKAETILEEAIQSHSGNVDLLARRGHIHLLGGEYDQAQELLEQCLNFDPISQTIQSELILIAAYQAGATTASLKSRERELDKGVHHPIPSVEWPNVRSTIRPLRIGYVSATFCNHSTSKVTSALLLNHDPDRVKVHLYMSDRRRDALSRKFRFSAHKWQSIVGLSDEETANCIRFDQIDILVDLDGHYQFGRPGIFRYRPAPVQLSGLGYVSGPSVSGIDYLLTDEQIVPPVEQKCFSEETLNLPCAQPFRFYPTNSELLPVLIRGNLTQSTRFGCFSRCDKLNDRTFSLWGEILMACENSILVLKNRFNSDAKMQNRIAFKFEQIGIDPQRICFETPEPYDDYLSSYGNIDIILDTTPVNGGITTLESLSQGVPVVTMFGQTPMGRIGSSIMSYLDLSELIFNTEADYVQGAITLATDPKALLEQRRRVVTSQNLLSDDHLKSQTKALEDIYREIWARHCASLNI